MLLKCFYNGNAHSTSTVRVLVVQGYARVYKDLYKGSIGDGPATP